MIKVKKMKVRLVYSLFLFSIWMLFSFDTSLYGMLAGAVSSIIISTFVCNRIFNKKDFKFPYPRILLIIRYSIRLVFEIYRASFLQILRIIKQDNHSVIVKIKLDVSDPVIITLIANSITLTPGTITVDIRGRTLYVLAIKDDGVDGENIEKSIKASFQKFFV